MFVDKRVQKAVASLIIFILHLEKSILERLTASWTSQGANLLIVLTGLLSLHIFTLFISLHFPSAFGLSER